jgi:hypothetical protein
VPYLKQASFLTYRREEVTKTEKSYIMRNFIIFAVYHTTRSMRWEGHLTLVEETKNAYSVLVTMPAGKTELGR